MGDTQSDCLVVQPHRLKHLKIRNKLTFDRPPEKDSEAKLRALADVLSVQPLLDLQSVHLNTGDYLLSDGWDVCHSYILEALLNCPVLDWLSIQSPCSISWDTLAKFPKLETLELSGCKIQIPCSLSEDVSIQLSKVQVLKLRSCEVEDIHFLDLCPHLLDLSTMSCRSLRIRKLSCKSELRSLFLQNLYVGQEFLNMLCSACPQLQSIIFDQCLPIGQTQPLGHLSQLSFLGVRRGNLDVTHVVGLSSKLRHLQLSFTDVTSDGLEETVQHLPCLEILDVSSCTLRSLHFLRHCAGLMELALAHAQLERITSFYELGGLRNLNKLSLTYQQPNFRTLADALRKMPQLKSLQVKFRFSVALPDLSFLQHCHQLHSVIIQFNAYGNTECLGLRQLANLKELRKLVLENMCFDIETLEGILPSMPHLEELHIGLVRTECDFSFLYHCPQLTSLSILFVDMHVHHLERLHHLEHLKRLVLERLPDFHLPSLVEQVLRMPQLEYLGLDREDPNVYLQRYDHNFLDSWEWRRQLSSLRS